MPKGTRQLINAHTVTIKCWNIIYKDGGLDSQSFSSKLKRTCPGQALARADDQTQADPLQAEPLIIVVFIAIQAFWAIYNAI